MSEPRLRLDFAYMMEPHVSDGIDPSRMEGDLSRRFALAHEHVEARRAAVSWA